MTLCTLIILNFIQEASIYMYVYMELSDFQWVFVCRGSSVDTDIFLRNETCHLGGGGGEGVECQFISQKYQCS